MSENAKKEPRMMAGVIILMLASLFEKILGVLFKRPLNDMLGDVGMGYFNSAYSIFSTFYTISLTGFPIAVSMMISRSRARGRIVEVNKIYRAALSVFASIGIVGSAIMFFGADLIANFIDKNNNSPLCIRAIAPILLIICLSSSIKGFFQGHQNMLPTAVSEFLDALGKCALGVVLAVYAVGKGYSVEVCAAFAIAGVTAGHLLGLAFLTLYKIFAKPSYSGEISDESDNYKTIVKTLFLIAVPITVSSVALGLTANIDTFTIMNCLDSDDGMAQYGAYSTLAVTLFRLPQAFIVPIASALTPALSSAISAGNTSKTKSVMTSAFKLASVISVPCTLGMSVLSYPIIYLIFGNENSEAAIARNAPYLSILSVGIFFMAMLTVTSSVLQSHKLEKMPVISTFCGAAVKLFLNIVLISNIGMIGAPISSAVGYFVMAAINFVFVIRRVFPELKMLKILGKTFVAAAVMAVCAAGVYFLMNKFTNSPKISVIIAILIAVVIYMILLFKLRGVNKHDILLFPHGEKIYGFFVKIKLMK